MSNLEQENYNNELFGRFIKTYHLTKQWEDFIKENPLEKENPILDVDFRDMNDISVRLLNTLYHRDIWTLRDVLLMGKKKIMGIRNIGIKSFKELEKILADTNLCWDTRVQNK